MCSTTITYQGLKETLSGDFTVYIRGDNLGY
jgi:hypothetical protein